MIDQPDVTKLLQFSDPHRSVLSVYFTVPLLPADHREVQAHLDEVLAPLRTVTATRAGACAPGQRAVAAARQADIAAVRGAVEANAAGWRGRSVAIFACHGLGLLEIMSLPSGVPSRAVIASRPYIRPLVAAVRRSPSYVAAVVDRKQAWLLRISPDGIETAALLDGEGLRSTGFGGWYGLEAYHVNRRVSELARRHYRRAADALERARRAEDYALLVVAGHHAAVTAFLATLPHELRDRFAGSAVIDPHVMTPARVRVVTDQVVSRWVEGRERKLAADLAAQPAGGAVSGVAACVTAVNQRAVRLLLVPDDESVPGHACRRCGTLALTSGTCAACGDATIDVPDIVEELVARVLEEGGQVEPVRAARRGTSGLAARLRFPLADTL